MSFLFFQQFLSTHLATPVSEPERIVSNRRGPNISLLLITALITLDMKQSTDTICSVTEFKSFALIIACSTSFAQTVEHLLS